MGMNGMVSDNFISSLRMAWACAWNGLQRWCVCFYAWDSHVLRTTLGMLMICRCSVNGNEPYAWLPSHSCPQRFIKEMPTADHLPSHLPRCFWCLATVAGGRPQGPLYFGCAFTLWLVAVAPRAR
eukprot:6807092-Lingulodinium_polyedra.AAC.1